MTSRQIECFLSVADNLNFTQSAKKLYASQSTVSRQISLLEEELGFDLFIRGNNYVRLTPAGATMLVTFQNICEELRTGSAIARQQNNGEQGYLRFGFYCNMCVESFLHSVICRFHDKYPNIQLSYECIPNGDLETIIRKNRYDLVFIHDFDQLSSSTFVRERIYTTTQVLVYGCAHPKAGREDLSLYDFKDAVFWTVADRDSQKRSDDIQTFLNHYGITEYRQEIAPNIETVLLNIRMGNGAIFLDPMTVEPDPNYYRCLELTELPQEMTSVGIEAVWLKNNFNPAISLFVNQFVR